MKKVLLAITILNISLNATPITLNNTGLVTKLEKFTPICTYYSKTIKQPQNIRQQCQKYKDRLDDILKTGYRLDKNIVSKQHTHQYLDKTRTSTNQSLKETSQNPIELENYRTKLLSLDMLREQIIEDISREKVKARRDYDVLYHEKLIREDVVSLYQSDYIFIAEHREVYASEANPRYIMMLKDKREELFSLKERMQLIQQKQAAELRTAKQNAEWMEMCGYNMTSNRHYAKKSGKISGKVSSAEMTGYFIKNTGGEGAEFFVKGGPPHTRGERITLPIYVTSKGEKIPTTLTNSRGVKTTSMALVVEYNDKNCN